VKPKASAGVILIRIAAVLFCLVLISTSMMSGLYARYTVGAPSGDGAGVARFVFLDEGLDVSPTPLLQELQPGAAETYSFTVTNQSTDAVSEVALSYEIVIHTTANLPITYKLTCETNGKGASAATVNAAAGVITWLGGRMNASEATEHRYTLTVSWPSEKNDAKYAMEIDYALLSVQCEQID